MVVPVALAINDANNTAISAYNCFSPVIGYGAALTSNVEISGIAYRGATNSTADLMLAGTTGTTIMNGTVKDINNVIWHLPASAVIGIGGMATVTTICSNSGAVAALAGTIAIINIPTRGRTSVVNPTAVAVGAPAETDAELCIRQGQSVVLPSVTPFEGVDGVIVNVAGAIRHRLYENDASATDDNKLSPHPISTIVDSGDVTDIAQTIQDNKGQGTVTYGTTSVTVPDTYGNPHVIGLSHLTDAPTFGHITLKTSTGYMSQTSVQVQQAIVNYINGPTIGDSTLLSHIYSPANLGVISGGSARYYDIQELLIGKSAGTVMTADTNITYNESASCKPENIILTVTS